MATRRATEAKHPGRYSLSYARLFSFEGTSVPEEMNSREEGACPSGCKGAYSSVWLERTPDKREVGSSNLPRPTK